MNTTICDAIRDGEIIEFEYEGMVRIVEPFLYGKTIHGKDCLNAYQIGGFNSTKDNSYIWDTYDVAKMGTVKFIGKKFENERAGYEPEDPDFKTIYCRF